jgi:SAM-dependent methyltransferase
MLTENNEVIEDNMIIEFKYDITKEEKWRWVPLRVRYDKTADLRAGNNNFGNAYNVANSNWHSIHNPISIEMITTGKNIPDNYENADIYYNRIGGYKGTKGLRDFHNLYVKNKLIKSVSKPNMTLIDIAVGKGGDIPKWINSNLKFVLGIDVSKDNIENRIDGACARYLNYRKKHINMPKGLFIHGDTSKLIKNGNALYTEKSKKLLNAVFGIGEKNQAELKKNIYNNYGVAKDGFDVCSIQFAIHYMFENNVTLNNLLRNVSEVTKIGGHFIGTSYDGIQIFNLLRNTKENDAISISDENDKLIWKITKRYNTPLLESNTSCLGLAIDVYQESINKTFREYLVNYDYLESLITNYGFIKLNNTESQKIGFKNSVGLFKDLFNTLQNESKINIKNTYGQSLNMTENEKTISFLNKYFIFKKVRTVNTENIYNNEIITSSNIPQKKIKKLKKKLILT